LVTSCDDCCRVAADASNGAVADDYAAADPEGAAAVLSGVKNILAGGAASLLSTGVGLLSGAAPQLHAWATGSDAVDDDVDPLLGQPISASSAVSDEEQAAIQAEDRAKSAAYAAAGAKSKSQQIKTML